MLFGGMETQALDVIAAKLSNVPLMPEALNDALLKKGVLEKKGPYTIVRCPTGTSPCLLEKRTFLIEPKSDLGEEHTIHDGKGYGSDSLWCDCCAITRYWLHDPANHQLM